MLILYPQQNDLRHLYDLSGIWDFKLDPEEVGEQEGWFEGPAESRSIAVPGSWNEQFADTQDYLGVIVGMHVWNLADFKTGQSNRRTGGMNFKGVFTRDRRPKMAAHFLRQRWNGDQS